MKDDPSSSWALYERFHTTLLKGLAAKVPLDDLMKPWPEVRRAILDVDPLFATMAAAETPDEAYELILRKETEELFREGNPLGRSTVRYAEIALDLGQPAFAAMLFSNVSRHIAPADYGDRRLTEDVLYCLEELGLKELKAGFPGDHAAEFQRIDAQRAKRKRDSPAVQAVAESKEPETGKKRPGH